MIDSRAFYAEFWQPEMNHENTKVRKHEKKFEVDALDS